jgi:uncharacterized membrane protein
MLIETDLAIAAPAPRVWDLTIDVERWPSLTPTITDVSRLDEGELRLGSSAKVVQPWQRPAVWTVTELEPGAVFAWRTKVATVTMTGRHVITPTADGCVNALSVELSGFGSGLLGRLAGSRIRQAIETENQGFKAAAESAHDERSARRDR